MIIIITITIVELDIAHSTVCYKTSEVLVQVKCTAKAAAALTETALTDHSSNPPRNTSQNHPTTIIPSPKLVLGMTLNCLHRVIFL